MVTTKNIHGKIFNISLNNRRMEKGWYLILTEQGEEFLVRRNLSLSSKAYFQAYQTDFSFREQVINKERHKSSGSATIGIAIAVSAFLRTGTPSEWWFGLANRGWEVAPGLINLLYLLVFMLLSVLFLAQFRKWRMLLFLKMKKSELVKVARVRAITPMSTTKKGIDFW